MFEIHRKHAYIMGTNMDWREENIVSFLNITPLQQPPLYQEQKRLWNTPATEEKKVKW